MFTPASNNGLPEHQSERISSSVPVFKQGRADLDTDFAQPVHLLDAGESEMPQNY